MDFEFSPEQLAFRDQVSRLLDDLSPLGEVRACLEGAQPYSRAAWHGLAEIGLTSVLVPERFGGLGLAGLELCVGAEAVGRHLCAVPLFSSIYMAAEALRLFGSDAQCERWLPRLAPGEAIGTVAILRGAKDLPRFEGGRIHGSVEPVPDGMVADFAIVPVAADGRAQLAVCELGSGAVERTSLRAIDPSKPQARVSMNGAAAELLQAADGASAAIEVASRAAVFLAFEQIGAADRALYLARDYALERKAFGRPIGANQAIKHRLADIYARIELARAHAYHGAWALSAGHSALPLAAAGARVAASQAFSFAAQECLHIHGGIGFTWEGDCQLFYRRARYQALALGSLLDWKEQIVSELERSVAGAGR